MRELESQPWYQLYTSTVIELDPARLSGCIERTEDALRGRMQELQSTSDHREERHMIVDARRNLSFLRNCPSLFAKAALLSIRSIAPAYAPPESRPSFVAGTEVYASAAGRFHVLVEVSTIPAIERSGR